MFDDQPLAYSRTRRVLSILAVLIKVRCRHRGFHPRRSIISRLVDLGGARRRYLARGDFDAAITDYTSSIKLEPVPPGSALFPRGVAYLRSGRFDLARDDFTTYAAACPDCGDLAEARDCAGQRSNTGKCAIAYPKPANPMIDQLMDAAGKSLSGCKQN
jgi:hypothetical protein